MTGLDSSVLVYLSIVFIFERVAMQGIMFKLVRLEELVVEYFGILLFGLLLIKL